MGQEALFIEGLLALQRPHDGLVDDRIGQKYVVVKLRERRVESINPSESLIPVLVRIRQAIENHGVGLDAVPSFSTSLVLDQVYPAISLRNLLVLVTIPLGDGGSRKLARETA